MNRVEDGEDFIEISGSNNNLDNLNHNETKKEFFINVLIRDKMFRIYCGEGNQKLRWLSDVAIFKYESSNRDSCGLAYSIKLENGSICNLNESINSILQNNENVWLLLKEEYDVYLENMIKN